MSHHSDHKNPRYKKQALARLCANVRHDRQEDRKDAKAIEAASFGCFFLCIAGHGLADPLVTGGVFANGLHGFVRR